MWLVTNGNPRQEPTIPLPYLRERVCVPAWCEPRLRAVTTHQAGVGIRNPIRTKDGQPVTD
jgi:hypothetical protein